MPLSRVPLLERLATEKFGKLTFVSADEWPNCLFRCSCGQEKRIRVFNVLRGLTRSCGCGERENRLTLLRAGRSNLGQSHTPEYKAWLHIKDRCHNKRCADYRRYGARGITVCQRWRESFGAFLADMGPRPSPAHSIDRKENNGNYEPGNCRWATATQQQRNRRDSRWLNFRGEIATAAEWCERLGLKPSTVYNRLAAGWTDERALGTPTA